MWTRMTPVRITMGPCGSARLSASNCQGVALWSVRWRVGKVLEERIDSAQEDPKVVVGAEDGKASPTQRRDFVDKHTQSRQKRLPRCASRCVASAECADESRKAQGQEWSSAGDPFPTHWKDIANG